MEKQYPSFILRCLRSDNDSAILKNSDVQMWMMQHGIKAETSAPYTPQQNGTAERAIRTLFDPTRAILNMGQLPFYLWPEIIKAVVYIKNRLPSRAVRGRIPLEILEGKPVSLNHLRVLGCDAYALFKAQGRHKLEPKSERYVLVGYGTDSTTYRLYHVQKRQVFEARDVKFNEEGYLRARWLPFHNHRGVDLVQGGAPRDIIPAVQSESQLQPPNTNKGDDDDDDEQPFFDARPPPEAPAPVSRPRAPSPIDLLRRLSSTADPAPIPTADEVPALEDESPPGSFRSESPDPLTDPKYHAHLRLVTAKTAEEVQIPRSYHETKTDSHAHLWQASMQEEYDSLMRLGTWELVDRPAGAEIISGKWVYDAKRMSEDEVRIKSRWVARGFSQKFGVNFWETFAQVVKSTSWHILLAIVAILGWNLLQIDIGNAFLNGDLEEEIYMEQPHGFVTNSSKVCRMKKALYGLKQAAHRWNINLKATLKRLGFHELLTDTEVYFREKNGVKIILAIHVDDCLVVTRFEEDAIAFQREIEQVYKVCAGTFDSFLGVQVIRDADKIVIHQQRKIDSLLADAGMADCRPVSTPLQPNVEISRADCPAVGEKPAGIDHQQYRSLVGSLMYIMTMTRPDICCAVKILSEALDNPGEKHVAALHWLLRYLKGSSNFGVTYSRTTGTKSIDIRGFYDADWARDTHDRKSRSGYVFLLGGGAISWSSGKQDVVATSTTHAEYIAQDSAARELVWIKQFMEELQLSLEQPLPLLGPLHGDNQGALALAQNPVNHKRSKHFEVKLHAIREWVAKKVLRVIYVPSQDNVADILTKPVDKPTLEKHRASMGMVPI